MRTATICLAFILLLAGAASAVPPTVSNIVARQLTDGTGRVSITYSLADPDTARLYISVAISTDGGATYPGRYYVTGDVGWVRPGTIRRVIWDAKAELGATFARPSCRVRIYADSSPQLPEIPAWVLGSVGMAILAGVRRRLHRCLA